MVPILRVIVILTGSIDIEESEIHRNFVGLRNAVGSTFSELALFDKDNLVLNRWAKDPYDFALQNNWLMIPCYTLVEVAKLTGSLCKLRFEMLATLSSARDLLLYPDNRKGTAESNRNHR